MSAKSEPRNEAQENNGESSEEEELVYLTFDSLIDPEFLQPETPFKIIGFDEEQPILQLGNQVYTGDWRDTIGTSVFLAEDPNSESGDPVFTKNPSNMLCYHSKTRKMLSMSRVFINPKNQPVPTTDVITNSADKDSASQNDRGNEVEFIDMNSEQVNTMDTNDVESAPNGTSSITVTDERPGCSYD